MAQDLIHDVLAVNASDELEIGDAYRTARILGRCYANSLDDTVPVMLFTSAGANGAACGLYVGSRDPNGNVSAPVGSYYARVGNETTSGLYINRTVASPGTTWVLLDTT